MDVRVFCILLSFIMMAAGLSAWAADTVGGFSLDPAAEKDSRIRIRADRLVADLEAGKAEFQGNVKVTQGNTVITADKLEIYRNPNGQADQTKPLTKESIQKIVAKGQVKIRFDNTLATSDHAEYDTTSETLILTGRGSKVTTGKNAVIGSRFVLHRLDGRFTVDGQDKEQVKAVFFSGAPQIK